MLKSWRSITSSGPRIQKLLQSIATMILSILAEPLAGIQVKLLGQHCQGQGSKRHVRLVNV